MHWLWVDYNHNRFTHLRVSHVTKDQQDEVTYNPVDELEEAWLSK